MSLSFPESKPEVDISDCYQFKFFMRKRLGIPEAGRETLERESDLSRSTTCATFVFPSKILSKKKLELARTMKAHVCVWFS